MIIGGAGISGRRLESTATLLGKRQAYNADYSLEGGSSLFDVLGKCVDRYLTRLPVVFPDIVKLPTRSSYPQHRSHVAWAQMFVDAVTRGVRQASSRASTAIAKAGTLPSHLVAVLTDCVCENLGSLEALLYDFGQRQAKFESEEDAAAVAAAASTSGAGMSADAPVADKFPIEDAETSSSEENSDGDVGATRGRKAARHGAAVVAGWLHGGGDADAGDAAVRICRRLQHAPLANAGKSLVTMLQVVWTLLFWAKTRFRVAERSSVSLSFS